MMPNLRSCRQIIEALADNQYPVSFEHIINQNANKIQYDSMIHF